MVNEDKLYEKIAEMFEEGICASRLDIKTISSDKPKGGVYEEETVAVFLVRKKWIDLVVKCLNENADASSISDRIRLN
jgi:hypothetical protein